MSCEKFKCCRSFIIRFFLVKGIPAVCACRRENIFITMQGKSKQERNVLIRKAHLDYGYTLTEIGKHVGLHYTTISSIIKKLE